MNTLNYKCYYDSHYDFIGEKYSSLYPYLHKYPATMIPQTLNVVENANNTKFLIFISIMTSFIV